MRAAIHRYLFVCLSLWTTCSLQSGEIDEGRGGTKWATAEEEALDEINDAKLYQAILQSVKDWQAKHNRTSRRWKREEGGAPPADTISSICYPEVGCFSDSGYLDMLPSPPEVVQTRFLMYSNSRGARRRDTPLLDVAFTNMSAIDEWATKTFNMSIPTKVIVHGFGSSCSHVWVYEMRSALMSVEKCNVLCVDWESGASFPNYVRAAANTRLVGRQLSLLLSSLRDKHGLDPSTVHIIGFSLGAHAAAFAGSHLGNVKRITGLDPAGPLFESAQPSLRLDPSDATYVDVIHSNGEALILGGLGSFQPMGHVDFYPNGGRMQNGCSNLFVGAFTDILWSGAAIEGRSLCNHRRAYKFFTDSVSPKCLFPAVPCRSYEAYLAGECFPCIQGSSCPSMGYYADKTGAKGTLYLVTRDEEPFCAHQFLVQVWSSKSALPVVSYGKIQLTLLSQSQINETFTLTQKDDDELAVGGILSRIIVPHPAMEDFTSVALQYTAYTGWISSGLAKWSIDKILLTDSLGKQMSMCEKDLVIESGVSIVLQLQPGDCGGGLTAPKYNSSDIKYVMPSIPYNASEIDRFDRSRFNFTQVVYIGEEDVTNSTNSYSRTGLEWEPILEVPARSGHSGNDLESSGSEDVGRGFRENGTFGRSLRKDKPKSKRRKHYQYVNGTYQKVYLDDKDNETLSQDNVNKHNSTNSEILEPVLKATTPKFRYIEDRWYPDAGLTPPALGATESWKHWQENPVKKGKNLDISYGENESVLRSFTIQLLPSRLTQLLEQAEKYAKLALAPFRFSDQGRSSRFNFSFPSLLSWASFRSDNSNKTETTTFSYGLTETEIMIEDYTTSPNTLNNTEPQLDSNSTSIPDTNITYTS